MEGNKTKERRRTTIVMVSEFFYPDIGGIETHICKLSENLIKLGFKVVAVTRDFGDRKGIRFMSNGLKVYHIPAKRYIKPCGLTFFLDTFMLCRNILIREDVDIIHSHQSSSRFGYEFTFLGSLMGYKTVFTDHSLFGFNELGPAVLTESLKHLMDFEDHVICVSNSHKENLVLRTQIDPRNVSVIGNAIESSHFTVDASKRPKDRIVIVVVSRLTERKGVHLLIDVVPRVCKKHDNVDFIIGGDGPMFPTVQEMIDRLYLHDRVRLLGIVPHWEVNEVLQKGHIFLNTSRTESFCMSILEAASCGLICVATNVGGVPEILPSDILLLAEYNTESIVKRIDEAIAILPSVSYEEFHERVKKMYSWKRVAEMVGNVYSHVLGRPQQTLREKLHKLSQEDTIFSR